MVSLELARAAADSGSILAIRSRGGVRGVSKQRLFEQCVIEVAVEGLGVVASGVGAVEVGVVGWHRSKA